MLVALMLLQSAPGWPWVGNAEPAAHLLRLGTTQVAGRLAGKPMQVRFTQRLMPGCHRSNWLHGAIPDRQDRCVRLARLEVVANGRAVALSPSRYADLGGLKDAVVRFAPAGVTLYLRGPDGPDYYGATLEISRRDIVRRRLDLADGGAEITNYRVTTSAQH